MLAYWKIRPRLLSVPGVANVAIWGERLKMLQVQVDPERLEQLGLTLDHVMEKTSDALEVGLLRYAGGAHIGTGGFFDTAGPRPSFPSYFLSPAPGTFFPMPLFQPKWKTMVLRGGGPPRLGAPG